MKTENLGLDLIRCLYRQPDTMALWGIPYDMRRDQAPRDLIDRQGVPANWIYLGSPGWWSDMTRERQAEVQVYLTTVADCVPQGPGEWDRIPRSPA